MSNEDIKVILVQVALAGGMPEGILCARSPERKIYADLEPCRGEIILIANTDVRGFFTSCKGHEKEIRKNSRIFKLYDYATMKGYFYFDCATRTDRRDIVIE